MRHKNQTVVITGGSQGIGRGIADKLAQEGARVLVGARKPPPEPLPDGIGFLPLDVSDEPSVSNFFEQVQADWGRLDILVNNAGIMFEKPFLEIPVADWDRMMAINLRGVFLCSQHAARLMLQQGGAIVNLSSIEGLANNPEHAPYAASKSGVLGLTRAIAVDMGQYGIRCNAVSPGWVETALNQGMVDSSGDQAGFDDALKALHPAGRLGRPEDIANLVSWLTSAEAEWVTGQNYTIDGGRLARLAMVDGH